MWRIAAGKGVSRGSADSSAIIVEGGEPLLLERFNKRNIYAVTEGSTVNECEAP